MLVIKNTFACVCMCGNFVVIILEYTTNAGAGHAPLVCHCIDSVGKGWGAREELLFFFGSHCLVLDLVFIQTE